MVHEYANPLKMLMLAKLMESLKVLKLLPYGGIRATRSPLCPSGHAADLGPGLKGLGPGGSILIGGDVVAAEMKEVVDLVVSGEETLCLAG